MSAPADPMAAPRDLYADLIAQTIREAAAVLAAERRVAGTQAAGR